MQNKSANGGLSTDGRRRSSQGSRSQRKNHRTRQAAPKGMLPLRVRRCDDRSWATSTSMSPSRAMRPVMRPCSAAKHKDSRKASFSGPAFAPYFFAMAAASWSGAACKIASLVPSSRRHETVKTGRVDDRIGSGIGNTMMPAGNWPTPPPPAARSATENAACAGRITPGCATVAPDHCDDGAPARSASRIPRPGVTPPPPLLLPLLMVVTPLTLPALPRRRRPLGQLALAGAGLVAAAAASWRPEASTHGRQDAGAAPGRWRSHGAPTLTTANGPAVPPK